MAKSKKTILGIADTLLLTGLGLTRLGKEKVEKLVNEWVKKGKIAKEEAIGLPAKLLQKGEKTRKELSGLLQEEIRLTLKKMGLATKKDINELKKEIRKLKK